jgi:SHS2 domain-containing protein
LTVNCLHDTLFCVGYEYLDISGDAGVRATAESLEELFEDMALGMYGLVTDLKTVEAKKTVTAEASGQGTGGLLVAWLNELVFQLDTHGFVGSRVKVIELAEDHVKAEVTGEEFDPERHERRLLIKAATYHDLKVEKNDRGGWRAEVIFDI